MDDKTPRPEDTAEVVLSSIPRDYNAAHDLLQRNLQAGRADQVVFVDERVAITYGELARRVDHFARGLHSIGVGREDRIMLCLNDNIDWPTIFLGAIKAGVVPVCVNTGLSKHDYDYMLRDSRAKALFVSRSAYAAFDGLHNSIPTLSRLLISEAPLADGGDIGAILEAGAEDDYRDTIDTLSDEPCFWLYSSGIDGHPRATIHCHASLVQMGELYAQGVLGISTRDRILSVAPLYSAYGLCNSLIFPMVAGAMAVLKSGRRTIKDLIRYLTGVAPAKVVGARPTVLFGVPAAFSALLADAECPQASDVSLRLCVSAGDALSASLQRRFEQRLGVQVLNGFSATEMLHIYLSNTPQENENGTVGKPVPGFRMRLVDEQNVDVPDGQVGTLLVNGPTAALGYWNQRQQTRDVFLGPWVKTGDRFWRDAEGFYHYAGRSDDLLKISGQFVSPAEIAGVLAAHDAVAEVKVIGAPEEEGLIRPKALVVLKHGEVPDEKMHQRLMDYLGDNLAHYKLPHWLEFVDVLPGNGPVGSPDVTDTDGSALDQPFMDPSPVSAATLVNDVLAQCDAAHHNLLQDEDGGR